MASAASIARSLRSCCARSEILRLCPSDPLPEETKPVMSRRDQIRMTDDEVDAFIHERRTMNVATFNHDGSIHLVAMWYGFIDGKPAFETYQKSQKVANLRRDPHITVLLEDGDR